MGFYFDVNSITPSKGSGGGGSGPSSEIENKNTNEGATNPLSIWQGTEQEYDQYEMSSWYNWETDSSIDITSTLTTVPARCNVFYGGGKYLYIDKPYIYVSDDGINWVPTYNDTEHALDGYECIVYGNNTYYVIGATVTIYSNDAENWSKTSTYSNMIVGWGASNKQPQTKAAYYKGNVIIMGLMYGYPSGTYYISNDGCNTWTTASLPGNAQANTSFIVLNDKLFLTKSTGSSGDIFYVSDDGHNWSSCSVPNNSSQTNLAYGNGIYLAGFGSNGQTLISTDGINWSIGATSTDIAHLSTNDGTYNSLLFSDGYFVASSLNTDKLYYSSDGINWSSFTVSTYAKSCGCGSINDATAIFTSESSSGAGYLICNNVIVDKHSCYTLDSAPTTSSAIYSEPSVTSQLTVTSVGVDSITLSDGYTYNRNSDGDVDIYRNVGEIHPDYLCFVNGIGVKINNITIATA